MQVLIQMSILCWIGNMNAEGARNVSHEFALRQYLFDPDIYNPMVRPRMDHMDKVMVTFGWKLIAFQDVSDRGEGMTVSGTISLKWFDEYLRWDRRKFGAIKNIVVTGKEIWTPNLIVRNRLDYNFPEESLDNKLLNIDYRGNVSIAYPEKFFVACDIDPLRFPFDFQRCHVILNVMTYSRKLVDIVVRTKLLIPADNVHGVWKICKIVVHARHRKDGGPVGIFVSFSLQRKPAYYVVMLIIPSTILSLLSVATFFIPDAEGEKITSSMTIFLSFVVFLIRLEEVVPQSSTSFPVIGIYFVFLMTSSVLMTINSIVISFATFTSSVDSNQVANISHEEPMERKERMTSVNRKDKVTWTPDSHRRCHIPSKVIRRLSFGILVLCTILIVTANCVIINAASFYECEDDMRHNAQSRYTDSAPSDGNSKTFE